MYRMDTALSLIVSEMQKIPWAKVEAHFLKKIVFMTNKCLIQDVFWKYPRATKTFQNIQQYANSYMHKFSRIFYKAILIIELHRLTR